MRRSLCGGGNIRAIPRPSKKKAALPGGDALKGGAGPGALAKEKTPIFGMLQRGGEVVNPDSGDVKHMTIAP